MTVFSMLYGHLISRHPVQDVSTLVQTTLPSEVAPKNDLSGIKCKPQQVTRITSPTVFWFSMYS